MNIKQTIAVMSLTIAASCAPSKDDIFGVGSRSGLIAFEHYEPSPRMPQPRTVTVTIEPDAMPQVSVPNTRCVYQFRVGDSNAYVQQPMIGLSEIRYIPQGWCSHLVTSRELQRMYPNTIRYRILGESSDGQSRNITILE